MMVSVYVYTCMLPPSCIEIRGTIKGSLVLCGSNTILNGSYLWPQCYSTEATT